MESQKDPLFDKVIDRCQEMGLRDIMGFRYDWNVEILYQFHASYYLNTDNNTMHWTTLGEDYSVDANMFAKLFALGSADTSRTNIHQEALYKDNELGELYKEGSYPDRYTSGLKDEFHLINNLFRATISPKVGDATILRHNAKNLLMRMIPDGEPFCISGFIWNELKVAVDDLRKNLPYAPYLMYMIEKVTKITFPKEVRHQPLQPKKKKMPFIPSSRPHPHSNGSSGQFKGRGSAIKNVLKSIFNVWKANAVEIRSVKEREKKNTHHLKRIERSLHIETSPDGSELAEEQPLEFDDPFAPWEEAKAAARAKQGGGDGDEEEEEEPQFELRHCRSTRASHPSYTNPDIEEEVEESEEEGEDDDDNEEEEEDSQGDDD